MVFLSFGAGVQSSVMLMMAIRGEIERPDHVLYADTGFEPVAVQQHAKWAERQCAKAGLPFHVVRAKQDLRESFAVFESGGRQGWANKPPMYVETTEESRPEDSSRVYKIGRGSFSRDCTRDIKIAPLKRKQVELLGRKSTRGMADGESVVMVGISTDEAKRAAPSRERWQEIIYPLIDPLKMSRMDCQSWWEANYPHVNLPSSSCVICPYKTPPMWRRMKESAPEDWATAVEYDERIRAAYAKQGRAVYLHRDFVPLADANLNEAQCALDLEDEIYCAGGCGL